MLLTPFATAVVLGRSADWLILPALAAVVSFFLLREPAIILARQAFRWRDQRPEAGAARRWLWREVPVLAASGALLLWQLPAGPLVALGAGGALITALAVWMALRNRQRSVLWQVGSAAMLSTSALLGCLASTRVLKPWAWWLWLLFFLHAVAAILVVRARLELMSSGRVPGTLFRWALAVPVALVAAAAGIGTRVAAPILFSAGVQLFELGRLRRPEALREPLKRVGWRALSASLAHAGLSAWALW